MRTRRCGRDAPPCRRTPRTPSPPFPGSRAPSSVAARPHSSGPRVVARDSAYVPPARPPRAGRRGRRGRCHRPHVRAAAGRARRPGGAAGRARGHARASDAAAPRPRPRPPPPGAVRRLARPVRARRLGTEHRDRAPRARRARRRGAGDARAGGAVAELELPVRPRDRRRAGPGPFLVPGYTAPRCKKPHHSSGDPARTVAPGAVLGDRIRGDGVRLARSGTPPGRGRAGARLSRRDGGHGRQCRARGDGKFSGRHRDGVDRSPRPAGREMRPLLRDRRAAFGVAVLAIVAAASVAAPLVSGGRPTAQGDIVATRFLPPLSGDGGGGFHVLGTDRFGRDVWTRLVYGARVSLAVGTLAVLLSITLGVVVGAAAGVGPGAVRLPLLDRKSTRLNSS